MQDRDQSMLASVLSLVAGVWIAISPIWLSMSGGQRTSVIITGVVIALASLAQLGMRNAMPSWVNAVAAVWLFISALVFTAGTAAIWNEVIAAIVVFLLAGWDGAEVNHFNQHHIAGAM